MNDDKEVVIQTNYKAEVYHEKTKLDLDLNKKCFSEVLTQTLKKARRLKLVSESGSIQSSAGRF